MSRNKEARHCFKSSTSCQNWCCSHSTGGVRLRVPHEQMGSEPLALPDPRTCSPAYASFAAHGVKKMK